MSNQNLKNRKVTLNFIGSGSAFITNKDPSKCQWQSNMLLTVEDNTDKNNLLIDCGGDFRHALAEQDMSVFDIDDIYVSHMHNDHIGGLECVALSSYFVKVPVTKQVPNPLYSPETSKAEGQPEFIDKTELVPLRLVKGRKNEKPGLILHESMIVGNTSIWHNALKAGLETLEDKEADLSTYFNVKMLKDNGSFNIGTLNLEIIQTVHFLKNKSFSPSYGLRFNPTANDSVFITTDTQFAPNQIIAFLKSASIIFHDCETIPGRSGVHAHYQELKTLPAEIKKKMWLYHYNAGPLPDAVADGFAGWVVKGQTFSWQT